MLLQGGSRDADGGRRAPEIVYLNVGVLAFIEDVPVLAAPVPVPVFLLVLVVVLVPLVPPAPPALLAPALAPALAE